MEKIKSVKEYKNIVEDLLEIDLGDYFVDSLYQLQNILIGRGVFDSLNSDIINITRIYIVDGKEYEFDNSLEEYNEETRALKTTEIDSKVVATTNLFRKGIGGLYDNKELWKDIYDLKSEIRQNLLIKVMKTDNRETRVHLISSAYQLIHYSYYSLKNILEEENLQQEEEFLLDLLLQSCDELQNDMKNTYTGYLTSLS